jgi:hypothetical protein
LASATVTINALLGEEGESGAGELVQGVPIVLQARPYPTWGAPKIREKLRPLCAPVHSKAALWSMLAPPS